MKTQFVILTLFTTTAFAGDLELTKNIAVAGAQAGAISSANSHVNSYNAQGQIQGQEQRLNNDNSINVEGDSFNQRRIPVSTAFAPSIAPTANCALSISGGFSVIGFSASLGKAYVDENCANLEKIRSVATVLGDTETAEAMLCQDESYAKARSKTGRDCK